MRILAKNIFLYFSFFVLSLWIASLFFSDNIYSINKHLYNFLILNQVRHFLFISSIALFGFILQAIIYKKFISKNSLSIRIFLFVYGLIIFGTIFMFITLMIVFTPFRLTYEGCGQSFNELYPDKHQICSTLKSSDYLVYFDFSGGKTCKTFDNEQIKFIYSRDINLPTFCEEFNNN